MQSPIQTYLANIHQQLSALQSGEVASYIPELSKVNPDGFGICLVTVDGVAYSVGDIDTPFTIQSISKAFVYAASLADQGKAYVLRKVGVEPSGDAFNSISLHPQTGAPLNPMINAGAIATTSIVGGANVEAQWERIASIMAGFVGHELAVEEAVYRSESDTGHRNRAIAWMLKNAGIIESDPMPALENYFRQCSLLVNCRDIAFMAATLANGGVHPLTHQRVLPAEHVDQVLSVMATCGMYDYAGSWLTEVGMPAKSGVGGGIIAVLPGRFAIGVYSPRLDAKGNSVRGIEVCKRISKDFDLNIFKSNCEPRMALGRTYTGADAPSRRQPTPDISAALKQNAHRIKYICLHGYLAVDGMEYIIRTMQGMLPQARCFILDMHRADGLSDSAARLLGQMRQELHQEGIAVVFSRIHHRRGIEGPLKKAMAQGGPGLLSFEDNDLAVEWCENRLIEDLPRPTTVQGQLADAMLFKGLPPALLHAVQAVSTHQTYAASDNILVSGQACDGRIFFIESGEVSILVPLKSGAHQRIAALCAGMVFGEMVLLGQTTRSATVHADSEVHCTVVQAEDLERIAAQEPQLKIILLENLAKDMAHKLRGSTQWIAALA